LTIQGGIFVSLIGYDGLYAKDNFAYIRPWTGDYTPYFMLGVNASYPVTPRVMATAFLVNGYWHLAHANDVPSLGGQLAYKATDRLTVKETVLYGPHQADTALRYWRFSSDSIVERKSGPVTAAFEYQIGTERVAVPNDPLALWMAAQAPVKWAVAGPWSIIVRPEFAWDRDGRWIGAKQSVKAFTSAVEFQKTLGDAQAIVALEYRVDDSRGPGGGFFTEPDVRPGVPALTPVQHLFGIALIVTFDGTLRR
jgi:Putative beta-barrel porin-2, OmpL-like. bbp2